MAQNQCLSSIEADSLVKSIISKMMYTCSTYFFTQPTLTAGTESPDVLLLVSVTQSIIIARIFLGSRDPFTQTILFRAKLRCFLVDAMDPKTHKKSQ